MVLISGYRQALVVRIGSEGQLKAVLISGYGQVRVVLTGG